MNIAYHLPSPETIYAYRTIFNGYKNAFEHLGHNFFAFTQDDNLSKFLIERKPDIFITSSHFYYQKFLDLELLKKFRENGLFLLTKIDFWDSPMSKSRLNEAPSMKYDKSTIYKIQSNMLGDAYFHTVEQNDPRMDGFEKTTKLKFHTIPLACDHFTVFPEFAAQFKTDISFVGTNLPDKRKYLSELLPLLRKENNIKIYGQDWTLSDRVKGLLQKVGQFYSIPLLRSIQRPKLELSDERKIYSSSNVSINIHEEYQRKFGGDCNERTFKIPAADGFQIVDNVSCIKKYFKVNEEIVIAEKISDWPDIINYYRKNPEKRLEIIEKGKLRVLKEHTYVNRVIQIIKLYEKSRKESNP